ncbi:hypothetical protein B0O99DRAFT_220786 [Bisporella sp. PMI_857]|nr:hypothetical protein B0O99DRAFT_220786 [Bisporella sp. PMI_857]
MNSSRRQQSMSFIGSRENPSPGILVAVEGDSQSISTQLQLLPLSQNILTLPSFQDELLHQHNDGPFDPRSYVHDVRLVLTRRLAKAREFLRFATSEQPRLCFMNGGSVAAREKCVSTICVELTGGVVEDAEAILNEIITDGMSGLKAQDEEPSDVCAQPDRSFQEREKALMHQKPEEDQFVKAMKAADSLDRQTAGLQEFTDVSGSIPILAYRNVVHEIENGLRTSSTRSVGSKWVQENIATYCADNIVTTTFTLPVAARGRQSNQRRSHSSEIAYVRPLAVPISFPIRPKHNVQGGEEDCEDSDQPLSPSGEPPVSGAISSPEVFYGEAYSVQLGPEVTSRIPVQRAKSLDRGNLGSREHDWNTIHRRSSLSIMDTQGAPFVSDQGNVSPDHTQLPKMSFVKAVQTTISRSTSPKDQSSRPIITNRYVDRGTDARNEGKESELLEHHLNNSPTYEPVFPIVEDHVIYFVPKERNEVLDSILNSYKDGTYIANQADSSPMTSVRLAHPTLISDNLIHPPVSHPSTKLILSKESSHDPGKHMAPTVTESATLLSTSLTIPSTHEVVMKFLHFISTKESAVVDTQNSFRALLRRLFPEEQGYSRHAYSFYPEVNRLWEPIFSNGDVNPEQKTKAFDQIIALGCEAGVQADYFSSMAGRVERLGIKRDGHHRSGRVNLRYLLTNALQIYSSLPLISRDEGHTLPSTGLLSTLLVHQLDVYFALNANTRFLLLIFPSDHLHTVTALRDLIGEDVFKIAGVIDSLASDPPRFSTASRINGGPPIPTVEIRASSSVSTGRRHRTRTNSSFALSPMTTKPEATVSFSKANFVLPSTANDTEVTTFISGIQAALIRQSSFYTPEPEPRPIVIEKIVEKMVEKPALPPIPLSPYPMSHRPSATARSSSTKIARLTGSDTHTSRTSGGSVKEKYAGSIASTTTVRTMASEKWWLQDGEWGDGSDNFYIGEEDSEDDDWDRRVMGRAGVKPMKAMPGKTGVGSKKKALKWLGLA